MAHVQRTSFDERDVEQSIAALKRGAYLLKYGRRGKPKFCPFRLSTKVQHELLSVYATQLLEKEHSGCHALLRDDKVEDLSRMYTLFSKIPRGLDPVSSIFKQHVTAEGTALVKQAEDAASNKKGDENNEDDEDIWLHDANETGNGGSLDNAKCKLLNWDGTKVVVAEGTIASTDSKALVHHVPLGPGCWKVWVNHVIVNASLFRPNREMFVLEDAIGSTVAWPTHFISFDFE